MLPEQYILLKNLAAGIFLASIIVILSVKAKFLTKSGAWATFILAVGIFGFGGWKWTVPIATFFVLSSILSKFRKKKNREVDLYFDKTGTRDAFQVFANGGLGLILVILNLFYSNEILYYFYVAVVASVCADTWSTEIGTMKKFVTYNICNFKKVEQGISGGVSLPGFAAALSGATIIAFSGSFWIEDKLFYFVIILISGFFGSIMDSLLGATLQLQYICNVCGKTTERKNHCGKETSFSKGFKFLNNDLVNFFAGLSGGLFSFILYEIIY